VEAEPVLARVVFAERGCVTVAKELSSVTVAKKTGTSTLKRGVMRGQSMVKGTGKDICLFFLEEKSVEAFAERSKRNPKTIG
jgi:hypothetical protein